ncbi:MAG: hypothetical protein ACLQQB_04785 [Solirubrobacteraceae bacterium]|jgi:hypothetical protein
MTPPPAAAAARTAAPAIHPRRVPLAPVRRPRRVSGPGARPARPAQQARKAVNPAVAIATHPLLDRLIHGRAWIGIVAFALIGIVTMQLGLLKLNAGIGRALEHEAALQREDSALSVENSEVAAGNTVELQAAHMGMQLIPAGALRFLSARGSEGDVGRALQALNARVSTPKQTSTESTSTTTESSASTAATTSTESTAPTESTTPVATPSTVPAQTTESAAASSTPTPAPVQTVPSSESGGATASPQG